MEAELDDRYLAWLHSRMVHEFFPKSDQSYYELFRILYNIEYIWLVTGDDNRAAYGVELRRIYLTDTRQAAPLSWLDQPCSVLEMLIAFSDIAEFETEIQRHKWFWIFIDTFGFDHLNDASNPDGYADVEPTIDRFLYRTYEPDGRGGLFPLNHPYEDQRKVELWRQFCAYAIERDMI